MSNKRARPWKNVRALSDASGLWYIIAIVLVILVAGAAGEMSVRSATCYGMP